MIKNNYVCDVKCITTHTNQHTARSQMMTKQDARLKLSRGHANKNSPNFQSKPLRYLKDKVCGYFKKGNSIHRRSKFIFTV